MFEACRVRLSTGWFGLRADVVRHVSALLSIHDVPFTYKQNFHSAQDYQGDGGSGGG